MMMQDDFPGALEACRKGIDIRRRSMEATDAKLINALLSAAALENVAGKVSAHCVHTHHPPH